MRLLFDENLSRKLVARLNDLYPASIHVAEAELLQVEDARIWEYAKAEDLVIVTTDADFVGFVNSHGPPPKVIWLRRWAHPTKSAEQVLRRHALRIADFAAQPDLGLLVLDFDS